MTGRHRVPAWADSSEVGNNPIKTTSERARRERDILSTSPNDTGAFYWTAAGSPVAWAPAAPRPALAVKRALDVVLAAGLLAAAAPSLLAAAVAIRATSRGPAFFVHDRIGYRCRRFSMIKLRTMVAGAEREEARLAAAAGGGKIFFKLQDDPRVTRVGRFLRRFSLDELPQLVNVLRGDMSLVGPRPLLVS
ncbi:MAG TPA: sugar transferase, partial [Thermoanaerobaculia bacterium]|nr:sugar transferase [Thermoanaerobaculia bacterium]